MTAHVESAFFGNNTPAWHGVGEVVKGTLKAAEAIVKASLNWRVEKRPFFVGSHKDIGAFVPAPDSMVALVRDTDEKVLGTATNRYKVHQNADCFAFLDEVVGRGLEYEAAGSLHGGRQVWMLAHVSDGDFEIADGDTIRYYLLITTNHDGSGATIAKLVETRVVCANTRAIALSEKGAEIRIPHVTTLKRKVAQAQELLGFATAAIARERERLEALKAQEMDEAAWQAFVKALIPGTTGKSLAARERLDTCYRGQDEVEGQDNFGTAFGAFQAATRYSNHHKTTRASKGQSPEQARMASVLGGSAAKFNNQALALLTAAAEATAEKQAEMAPATVGQA